MDSLCDDFGQIAVVAPVCDNLWKPKFTGRRCPVRSAHTPFRLIGHFWRRRGTSRPSSSQSGAKDRNAAMAVAGGSRTITSLIRAPVSRRPFAIAACIEAGLRAARTIPIAADRSLGKPFEVEDSVDERALNLVSRVTNKLGSKVRTLRLWTRRLPVRKIAPTG
jgi:hypothetical protein